MGLNYDWTTMNDTGHQHVANGNTNQAIGLQLGWLSLVGGGPFTSPAMDPNYTVHAGHHPADRRLEHAGPLVHEPELDRQPSTA